MVALAGIAYAASVFFCVLQITAMYIDGHLKGGFQTVEAYAGFCGYFKNWLDTKSIKLSVPRQGELVAEDYRACLEYVNSEVTDVLNIQIFCQYFTDQIAHLKDFYFRWRFCFVLDVKGKKCHYVFLGEVVSLIMQLSIKTSSIHILSLSKPSNICAKLRYYNSQFRQVLVN